MLVLGKMEDNSGLGKEECQFTSEVVRGWVFFFLFLS